MEIPHGTFEYCNACRKCSRRNTLDVLLLHKPQILLHSEAREARSAEPFFSWVSKGHKPLLVGLYTRVGCLERLSLFVRVCVYVCVSQRSFRPRLSTAINVHGTKASPNGSRARTKNRQLFWNWFRCKSLRVCRGRCGKVRRHQNWVPILFVEFSKYRTNVPELKNTAEPRHLSNNRQHAARDETASFVIVKIQVYTVHGCTTQFAKKMSFNHSIGRTHS